MTAVTVRSGKSILTIITFWAGIVAGTVGTFTITVYAIITGTVVITGAFAFDNTGTGPLATGIKITGKTLVAFWGISIITWTAFAGKAGKSFIAFTGTVIVTGTMAVTDGDTFGNTGTEIAASVTPVVFVTFGTFIVIVHFPVGCADGAVAIGVGVPAQTDAGVTTTLTVAV